MAQGQRTYSIGLALVCGVVLSGARPAVSGDITPRPDYEAVQQFHERMAENKARGLDTRRLAERMALASVNQNNYDVRFYDVYIETHYYSQVIYGSVGFVAAATEPLVDEVDVDFSTNMTVDSVVAPSGHLSYTHSNDYISITLDVPYSQGELFEFIVYYSGNPQSCGSFYAAFFDTWQGYPIMNTMSEPYGARCFWPCKDHPGDKPDSMDIAVEVGSQFYVATNGVLDSVVATGGGRDTYYYRVRYPMATYLFALSIADFTVYTDWYYYNGGADSMPIINHCYPGLYGDALYGWGITAEAIEIYAANYGEYPFLNEKYGHANVNYAGMEHQTITAGDADGFGFSEYLVIHELAHHWWGNLITCASWHDIWLNEGWGTYSEAVYYLDLYGWDFYFDYMEGLIWDRGGSVYCTDTTNVNRIFHVGLSYHKGAWVAHMLRGKLGDSLFFAGIDAWFNSGFRFGSATTEDFKNVWEIATGVELDAFIDQWVYGEYFPHYHLFQASEPTDSTGYNIYMAVKQMQTTDPEIFEMPVEFAFFFEDGSSDTMWFDINEKKQKFKFVRDNDIIPDGIEIDPRGWILKEVTNREWGFFIVTPDDEISNGEPDVPYADTVEVFGGSGDNLFLVVEGALPTDFTINNDGVISGITSDTGLFSFRVHAYDLVTYETDESDFTIRIGTPSTCCGLSTGGMTGNANCDEEGLLSLSDITRLIDRVYISREPLCCDENGNVNGSLDGQITLSDITRLIDAVYVSKHPTASCL